MAKSFLKIIFLACLLTPSFGYDKTPAITFGKNATHIARITNDSLIVITGSTYSFTVDTPEDQGLRSTGTTVKDLLAQIVSKDGSHQTYHIINRSRIPKTEGYIESSDQLVVTLKNGSVKTYKLGVRSMALSGKLQLEQNAITINTKRDLTLYFTAGQRSPDATVHIYIPDEIEVTPENTTVNVIGRGDVTLKDLPTQSIGRVGSKYPYSSVGNFSISKTNRLSTLTFTGLDLRPANGADLKIVIKNVLIKKTGSFALRATYTISKPETLSSAGVGTEITTLFAVRAISDFRRELNKDLMYKESSDTYTKVQFHWTGAINHSGVELQHSLDEGKTWNSLSNKIDVENSKVTVSDLKPDKLHMFRLYIKSGENKGHSNIVKFYAGKLDVKTYGVTGEDGHDDTDEINEAINFLNEIGGGTLLFSDGVYNVRTVHLKSNVYLFVSKGATIKALKGADAPESTWFSDKKYRSGLSPTDTGPYADPENYLTKQDVGHHYFRNTMFFGERLDNVKIVGNGLITGNGNLVTGDKVMNNAPDNRADKMFTFKLCSNIEIGGIARQQDLWYDSAKDEPYYINDDGTKDFNTSNMLNIDRGGHFVLLATGTDTINVHNTYFAKHHQYNARDIYDFMECNNVTVTNIYSKVSSDDIVKPGSDCSLGFTRPARNYKVRNIIGDTNCNLFQIGSETADDIMDVHVDNVYVLGANKAGFSISTNDGGHIKDIHLNCGHTGPLHSRSKMYRSFTPFFISISNRGRVIGAEVGKYTFSDNGETHNELLVKNVNIGTVENILLNSVDVYEVYAGSSFGEKSARWKPYDGSQRRTTPIVAGYSLPDYDSVERGLDFTLPNGKHTGYVTNIEFKDVHVLVKGGNEATDTTMLAPELGVGQYNASNLKVLPSYGLWARHVKNLTVANCSFNFEALDHRYPIFLDDVLDSKFSSVKAVRSRNNVHIIKTKNAQNTLVQDVMYYVNEWGKDPGLLLNKISGKE
jgi:polygalacturonase